MVVVNHAGTFLGTSPSPHSLFSALCATSSASPRSAISRAAIRCASADQRVNGSPPVSSVPPMPLESRCSLTIPVPVRRNK